MTFPSLIVIEKDEHCTYVCWQSQYESDIQSRSLRLSDAWIDVSDTVPVNESVHVPSLLILRLPVRFQ